MSDYKVLEHNVCGLPSENTSQSNLDMRERKKLQENDWDLNHGSQ